MKTKFTLRFYEWLAGLTAVGFTLYLVSGCGQPLCIGGLSVGKAGGCNFPIYSNTPYAGGGTGSASLSVTPSTSQPQNVGASVSCSVSGGTQPYVCGTIIQGTITSCTPSGANISIVLGASGQNGGTDKITISDAYGNYGYCSFTVNG